jgi:hypothetical protein
LLDRLLHHVHIVPIAGESDRLKDPRKAGSIKDFLAHLREQRIRPHIA